MTNNKGSMKLRAVFLLAIGCFLFGRVASGSTQLLTNGGFEGLTPAPWTPSPPLAAVPVVTDPGTAHSGNNYLSLGNLNGITNEAVFQSIDVPTNVLVARFTYFWGCSIGQDTAGVDRFTSIVQHNGNATALDQQLSANTGYQFA